MRDVEVREARVVPEALAELEHALVTKSVTLQVEYAQRLVHLEELSQVAGAFSSHVVLVARIAVAQTQLDECLVVLEGLEQAGGAHVRHAVLREVEDDELSASRWLVLLRIIWYRGVDVGIISNWTSLISTLLTWFTFRVLRLVELQMFLAAHFHC